MDLVVTHQNYVVHSSTDQGPSDRRDIRNGSVSRVRFVFPDDSKRLAATVVALERNPMPECDCFELNRRWDDLSGPHPAPRRTTAVRKQRPFPRRRGEQVEFDLRQSLTGPRMG